MAAITVARAGTMRPLVKTSLRVAVVIAVLVILSEVLIGDLVRPALRGLAGPAATVGVMAERAATMPMAAGRVGMGVFTQLAELAIICVFAVPIIAILGGVFLAAIKMLRNPAAKSATEDTRVIQEIYQGLQRMEKRVEALETILLEKERRDQ